MEPYSSSAVFRTDLGPMLYRLGTIIDKDYTNATLADILQSYDEKVSGTKKELLERIAELVVRLYKMHKKALDKYFMSPYLKLNYYYYQNSRPTTIIDPGIDAGCLSHMVVAAYVAKHLRAERVLSSNWENTTYQLKDLISSIIDGDITVNYNFIKIMKGGKP
jgi:hypothetical protein